MAETAGVDKDGKWEKPVVLCEYGHAMGNGKFFPALSMPSRAQANTDLQGQDG
jgi:hypothetical protein